MALYSFLLCTVPWTEGRKTKARKKRTLLSVDWSEFLLVEQKRVLIIRLELSYCGERVGEREVRGLGDCINFSWSVCPGWARVNREICLMDLSFPLSFSLSLFSLSPLFFQLTGSCTRIRLTCTVLFSLLWLFPLFSSFLFTVYFPSHSLQYTCDLHGSEYVN